LGDGLPEINLNLGCPSGTVVAKRKGAGFLSEPELLDAFFDRIFSAEGIPAVSVKTRLGVKSPDEFAGLLRIYNKYPISGLIVHARTLTELYKGPVHPEVFAAALAETKIPLCYNGNLFRREDLLAFSERFPTVKAVMIGRGLVANPALVSPNRSKRNGLRISRRPARKLSGGLRQPPKRDDADEGDLVLPDPPLCGERRICRKARPGEGLVRILYADGPVFRELPSTPPASPALSGPNPAPTV
jgi:tRNA-dihydrouridine synthase